MSIIFRGTKIIKDFKKSVIHITKSTLRSMVFLSFYVAVSWSSPCFFRNWRGKDERWMYYVNGLLAGAMVLIEQPGRRLELGMYCLPRAIESLWNSWLAEGYVRPVP